MTDNTVSQKSTLSTSIEDVLNGAYDASSDTLALLPFSFDGGVIRVILGVDDDPIFVAKDVAKNLGYERPQNAIERHCKYAKPAKDYKAPQRGHIFQSLSGDILADTVLIPESDVYRLIMRSQLESAERFQDWVTEDLLPALRKTGGYGLRNLRASAHAQIMLDAAVMFVAKFHALVESGFSDASARGNATDFVKGELGIDPMSGCYVEDMKKYQQMFFDKLGISRAEQEARVFAHCNDRNNYPWYNADVRKRHEARLDHLIAAQRALDAERKAKRLAG